MAPPRIFNLRRRSDLEVHPQRRRRTRVWVVKDPLSLHYFQFREEEFAILSWLDGRSTLEQIKSRFEQRFAPQRMTVTRLHAFVANLHRNSLVISDSDGQGEQLLIRAHRRRRDSWIASLSNPLAIRFRGFDPQRFIDWLYPRLAWLFTRGCIAVCGLIFAAAVLLVVSQFDQFQSRLPGLNALIHPQNLLWLGVAIGLTKVLHEFGHALVCRHFGGACHEMGVMLLVFTPCLYCNVTDAWKLPDRWHRVAITAAGIGVEVVLASLCALLWWFSQPGFFNTLCLNIMVVCSVGTVLLNGNPLLRYDGYYILSDGLELPNLWQDSRSRMGRLASRFFWGFDPGNAVSLRNRSDLVLLYAVASTTYRAFVVVSVLYLVYQILAPLGLLIVAQLIVALAITGIVSVPLRFAWRTLASPIQRRRIKPARVAVASCTLAIGCAAFFLLPLPFRIAAPATIQPLDAKRVYVSVAGTLTDVVAAGEPVQQGEVIASLDNADVRRDDADAEGQLLRQQLRVRNLESLRGRNAELAAQLPAAREILADLELRREQTKRDVAALSLKSPISGTVISPPRVADVPPTSGELPAWTGTPLEHRNLGCHLDRQTLLCLVGQPNRFEAILYIDQSDVRHVRQGQPVRLTLDIAPGRVLQGEITEISRNNAQFVPAELAVDQEVANQRQPSSLYAPQQTSYQAYVRFEARDAPLLTGATGRAKITVEPQPLSSRLYRFLARTFKPVL